MSVIVKRNAHLDFAKELGLKMPAFKMDLQDPTFGEKVEVDFESGCEVVLAELLLFS